MTAPDYVFPVVGLRVWRWNATGLKSLNGVPWKPGEPFTAECRTRDCKEAPRTRCSCGVYASTSLDHLRRLGYTENRVYGEVSLWGRVVEHEHGWRAEFAYPRSFHVPVAILPSTMNHIESWLAVLLAYRCDIFLLDENSTVPLWLAKSGFDPSGIDLIVKQCAALDERRREQRRLKRGDRVAVVGHGIAVIEHAGRDLVRAVLSKRNALSIERKAVVWDERNRRWETTRDAAIHVTTNLTFAGTQRRGVFKLRYVRRAP